MRNREQCTPIEGCGILTLSRAVMKSSQDLVSRNAERIKN